MMREEDGSSLHQTCTTMEIKKYNVNNIMCEKKKKKGEQKGTDAFAMVDRIRRGYSKPKMQYSSVMQRCCSPPNPIGNVYYITIDSYPKCSTAVPLLIPYLIGNVYYITIDSYSKAMESQQPQIDRH